MTKLMERPTSAGDPITTKVVFQTMTGLAVAGTENAQRMLVELHIINVSRRPRGFPSVEAVRVAALRLKDSVDARLAA